MVGTMRGLSKSGGTFVKAAELVALAHAAREPNPMLKRLIETLKP
jgi:hypothetical protein